MMIPIHSPGVGVQLDRTMPRGAMSCTRYARGLILKPKYTVEIKLLSCRSANFVVVFARSNHMFPRFAHLCITTQQARLKSMNGFLSAGCAGELAINERRIYKHDEADHHINRQGLHVLHITSLAGSLQYCKLLLPLSLHHVDDCFRFLVTSSTLRSHD
jgi:hypothetical protein